MADLRERLGLSLSFPFDVVGFVVLKGTESLLSHDEQKCYNTKLFDLTKRGRGTRVCIEMNQ